MNDPFMTSGELNESFTTSGRETLKPQAPRPRSVPREHLGEQAGAQSSGSAQISSWMPSGSRNTTTFEPSNVRDGAIGR